MKQAKWLLLLAVGILMVLPGCKQLGNVPVQVAATDYNIYAGNDDQVVGTCNISNDASNFYVTITMNGDWWLEQYHIWVGDNMSLITNAGDPPEEWHRPAPGSFPYKHEFSPPYPTSYTVTIPVNWSLDRFYSVIHLAVANAEGQQTAYVGGTKVGHWWCLTYTPGTNGGTWEETSWAGDLQFAGKNWARYFTYTLDAGSEESPVTAVMYAGNPKNGAVIAGTVYTWNDATNLYVKYSTESTNWEMYELHLSVQDHVGLIPQTRNKNPIPGLFELHYNVEAPNYFDHKTFTIALSDLVWGSDNTAAIGAHAVVVNRVDPKP